jgi:hypothetical protein
LVGVYPLQGGRLLTSGGHKLGAFCSCQKSSDLEIQDLKSEFGQENTARTNFRPKFVPLLAGVPLCLLVYPFPIWAGGRDFREPWDHYLPDVDCGPRAGKRA